MVETFLRVGLGNAVAAGLLALAAASVGVFAGRRPALRHGLWLLVLLKLVTPPLWWVPVAWVGGTGTSRSEPTAVAAAGVDVSLDGVARGPIVEAAWETEFALGAGEALVIEPLPAAFVAEGPVARSEAASWVAIFTCVWLGGSLVTFGVAWRRIQAFRSLLRLAEPATAATRAEVETLTGRLGLPRAPSVWGLAGAVSPLLWALGCQPRLIVPTTLWDRLDAPQRATLLTHELAHLKRRDHWVRWLELLVTGLYWWFPVTWIARHALREAEEQCCDAWVVWAFPEAARTYAEALLETVDYLSRAGATAVVAACGLGPVHHLKRRMTMILQGTTPRTLTWGGLLAVLGLSATLLPLSPTWAQRPEDDAKPAAPESREAAPRPEANPSADRPDGDQARSEHRVFRFDDGDDEGEVIVSDDSADRIREKVAEAIAQAKQASGLQDGEFRKAMEELQGTLKKLAAQGRGTPLDGRQLEALERAVEHLRAIAGARRSTGSTGSLTLRRAQDQDRVNEQRAREQDRVNEQRAREQDRVNERRAREQDRVNEEREEEKEKSQGKEAKERAEQQRNLKEKIEKGRVEVRVRKRGDDDEATSKSKQSTSPEQEAETAKLKAEVQELREEVQSRRKALQEAEARLQKAAARLGEKGGDGKIVSQNQRFEVRINKPTPPQMAGRPNMPKELFRFVPGPEQDKRIAELEARLERLQDEVKSMKKDAPERR